MTDLTSAIDPSLVLSLNQLGTPLTGMVGKKGAMNLDQINRTAQDFESVFISQMAQNMFGDSIGSEAFGSEETSDIYKSMMMNEFGKQITKAGGIGIAGTVKQALLKLQEM